jgi:Cys-rich four helix bundle protein (predicted Tat secretion target)
MEGLGMKRRDMLIGAATVAAGALAGTRAAAQPAGEGPASMAQAVAECLEAGNACMEHCLDLLASGDKTLGDCAKSVHQMLAVCNATAVIVATDSTLKARVVQLCIDACAQCEQACKPHIDHHAACRRCRDACLATIAAAKRLG